LGTSQAITGDARQRSMHLKQAGESLLRLPLGLSDQIELPK